MLLSHVKEHCSTKVLFIHFRVRTIHFLANHFLQTQHRHFLLNLNLILCIAFYTARKYVSCFLECPTIAAKIVSFYDFGLYFSIWFAVCESDIHRLTSGRKYIIDELFTEQHIFWCRISLNENKCSWSAYSKYHLM